MAQKKFKQFFAKDFIGIDGEMSAIEEGVSDVSRAVNYEMAVGNSLRGRVGFQLAGQGSMGFFAISPYRYTRTEDEYAITYASTTLTTTKTSADGASIEKLVGVNDQLWVRDTMTIPITYVSGSYPFTWYTYVNGSNINFVIKANGVAILDTNIGSGIGVGSTTSIYDLLGTIDALAELSVSRTTRGTCPPFAIINGTQSSTLIGSATYGRRYQLTVDAGHNFYPGDVVTLPEPMSVSLGYYGYTAGIVTARTATTITYVGKGVTLSDNTVLGYMNQTAAAFEIDVAQSAASGNLSLVFPYWRLIPEGDANYTTPSYGNPFRGANSAFRLREATSTNRSYFLPATFHNASGNVYIAASTYPSGTIGAFDGALVKADGTTVVRAGLPQISMTATAIAGGALAGEYKYQAFLRRIDAQGNVFDGEPSVEQTVTYGGGNNQGTIVVTPPLYSGATGYQGRSCYKYTNESPAAGVAFSVDDNSAAPGLNAFIQPGDPIVLMDNTARLVGLTGVNTLHRTYCTFYDGTTTPSSIKVEDSSGYQINDNSPISTGLTVVIVRNTAGGNIKYVLAEVPITGYATYSFTDNVTDAVLSAEEQFIDAEIGKEHNPPPSCSLVCGHQGGLCVARGASSTNTVSFSSYEGIEYFPVASNSFDIPSTQTGAITAIVSDTDDRLAVFKDRAYYDVVGDLDGGTFSINVRNEGDYGITSQASLARVRGILIGLSRSGFIAISNGELSSEPFTRLNARLINQDYKFEWATATNDWFNRHYICSIPTETDTDLAPPVTYIVDYSRGQLWRTFERSYPTGMDPSNGMAMVGNTLFHCSMNNPNYLFRRLYRFNGDSPSGNGDGDSFIDHTSAISYILESSVINHGEPDILNTPIRARVWSIPNDYVVDGWVPHSILVEGGCSPLAANCGTGNNSTSSTITFAASSDLYKDVKLVSTKTHFYIIRFTTNTIRTAPFITGYEILYAESYDPEDLIK